MKDVKVDGVLVDDTITFRVEISVDMKQSSLYDSRQETGFVGLRNQGGVCFLHICVIAHAAWLMSRVAL